MANSMFMALLLVLPTLVLFQYSLLAINSAESGRQPAWDSALGRNAGLAAGPDVDVTG
jgi:hypothetical protein